MLSTFKSFTPRQRNILIAIVAAPVVLLLLGNWHSLIDQWQPQFFMLHRTLHGVFVATEILFLVALVIVCATRKKWKLLWPLFVFIGASLVVFNLTNALHDLLWQLTVFARAPYDFTHATPFVFRLGRLALNLFSTLANIASHASIWLTVYLTARHFKQQNKSTTLEEINP